MKAPLPPDEAQRLAALRQYDVLDTPAEAAFDDLTLLASQICQTPIAMVSLVDEQRQWFKSKLGVSTTETAREVAFCAHTILHKDEVMEVRDAQADPRFADSTLVTSDPHIRFYAGAPLVTPAGHALGALCVVDRTPRQLSAEQLSALRALSRHVVAQLELRRQARELRNEVAERQRAETRLREQNEQLARSEQEAARLLTLAEKSRSALLSVLEDEQQAGKKMRLSEERFRQLAENIDEVFWITDPAKNQRLYISPAYETIWRRTCDSLYRSPETWPEAIHADDRERVRQAAARQADGTYDEEYRIVRPDGAVRWIRDQAFPVRDAAGQVHRIVGVARDITERKQAILALSESRHLLEKAQEIGQIGSWVSDPGPGGKLNWSAETCRIFGVRLEEFDGRVETFFALVHPDDRDAVAEAARAALAGERPYDLEHRITRRDGQVRWVHEQADVERDAVGQPLRMVGVAQDITDRRQLGEQLRQSQKMEAIGQLAGGIAHDFNNILGAILGNTELARLMPPGSREASDCLDSILTASHRATDLVRQILAFSRRQEAKRQPIQLHLVVKEALKLLRATVPAAIEFRTNVVITPTVLADPSEIHQVTMNLCTNAWHAMKDRPGTITVELAETQVDDAFARVHPDLRPGRYVRLTVADSGCGMDAVTLERIFEPFFTTKPVGVGTGLGLAVVHGIVKNHDGGIVVQSQPGVGTTFHLYFPVFESEVVEAPAEPQPIPRGHGEHILFVDDEEPLAKLGKAALGRLGYQVTQTTSSIDALELFRAQPGQFDMVITDFNMPGMNGTTFAERLLEIRPDLRLVLATGYSATINEEAARRMGFRELLPKPYDLRSLGETAQRVLGETTPPK